VSGPPTRILRPMNEDNPLLAGFKPRSPVHHQPVELAELWTLRKSGRHARCVLVEHPAGVELRVMVDAQLVFSQVHLADGLARDAAIDHQRDFEALGWVTGPDV
jgi:hypothetical protein